MLVQASAARPQLAVPAPEQDCLLLAVDPATPAAATAGGQAVPCCSFPFPVNAVQRSRFAMHGCFSCALLAAPRR